MNITQLPFPRHIGIKHIKEIQLQQELWLEQWRIPKGTLVKLYVSGNFGVVLLPEKTKDVRGFVLERRIFKY